MCVCVCVRVCVCVCVCGRDVCNTVRHTYFSKSIDAISLIDHMFVSEKCGSLLLHYDEVHGHNHCSDHWKVKCVMDFNVKYVNGNTGTKEPQYSKPTWGKSSIEQIGSYRMVLGSLLNDIDIPQEAAVCHDKMCRIHNICAYRDDIVMVMIQAYSETIPISKSGCSNIKAVPEWNEYIERYFKTSLYWHSVYIDSGHSRHGIVAYL